MALCKTMIIGNLGADPEMRYTPNGRPVTQLHRRGQPEHEEPADRRVIESTDWFRVSVWGDRGERAAENLRKGDPRLRRRPLPAREYEGQRRPEADLAEITADSVVNLEKRTREEGEGQFAAAGPAGGSGGSGGPGPSGGAPRGGGGTVDDTEFDDLPF